MSYFPPPRRIETTVFTRLPDHFRRPRRTAWCDANRGGREVDSFLEGPAFDRQGRLYVTDIPFGRVFRISPDGEWEQVAEYDGWPNGLAVHRDGRIFITDYRRGLVLLDPETGAVDPFLETALSEGFKGVNDLVFSTDGDLYFTDQGQTGLQDPSGRVYRYSAAGVLASPDRYRPEPERHRAQRRWQGAVRGRDPCQPDLAPAAACRAASRPRPASSPTFMAGPAAPTAWRWTRKAVC